MVLPSRNEAGSIAGTVREVMAAAERIATRVEVIVVDDASEDGTGEAALSVGDGRVRVVRREMSRGYGAALRTGFEAATGAWVFYTDGDGQVDPSALTDVPQLLATADAVVGFRVNRAEGCGRRFNAWAWTLGVNVVFGLRARDVDCAFKVMPGEFVRGVRLVSDGALISAELLAHAKRAGLRVATIGVRHRPRRAGRASGASLGVIVRAVRELLTLSRRIRRGE
ncbi:MAG: hypothetical protein HBSAPP03_12260 [Phycisphaerae bacterium]|nr:MAG: hypothetical protein HBSAPP03_12260 [Phycisphaerae bacterium]